MAALAGQRQDDQGSSLPCPTSDHPLTPAALCPCPCCSRLVRQNTGSGPSWFERVAAIQPAVLSLSPAYRLITPVVDPLPLPHSPACRHVTRAGPPPSCCWAVSVPPLQS